MKLKYGDQMLKLHYLERKIVDAILGTPPFSNLDEFSEKFQTASEPPLVLENYVVLFATKLFGLH